MGRIILGLLTSPDYTMKDFKAVSVNGMRRNRSLFQELIRLVLRETLAHVTIPYFIMQGDADIVTSTKFIESFVRETGNDHLHFDLVKNSGHMPGGAGMAYVIEKGFAFLCAESEIPVCRADS